MSGAAFGLSGRPARGTCPCGSGVAYRLCCGRYHDGEPAPTPEALMRSRYCAFALRLADYLLATWHPTTRPRGVDLDPGRSWDRLEVVSARGRRVRFRAHFTLGGRAGVLEEDSRFERVAGRWFYVDGEHPDGH